jgi:signal transduction histidine kinase
LISVVVTDKKQIFYYAVIMINLSALYLISFYYPGYVVRYESESVRFLDLFTTMIIVTFILFAFLKVHSINYIEERTNASMRKAEVEKLNHALKETNNKISDKNKLLEDLSKVLEENNIIISKQLEELNEAYRQLQISNKTQTKFLSIISHDLRSPIGSFKSLTSSIVNDYNLFSKDEQKNLIELMSNSAGSIYELLENLLTWSSIQQGRIAFNPQLNNIFQTVDITFKLLEISAMSKRIKLVNLVNKSTIAFFDENMIVTVVRNLVSNALKFSRPDSIIVISAIDKDNFVEVRVKDKGMGIKSEDLDKLFRIDVDIRMISPSPYTSEKGTGLGLILCREFVEKNGGTIQVESTLGVGSTFIFTIPKS